MSTRPGPDVTRPGAVTRSGAVSRPPTPPQPGDEGSAGTRELR
ncbi:MAG TPA: hypothetical protein VD761_00050 [Solirubrobacterales bacterium]|nr:hypothetical protein [Solirubrobacterales bacterium]